MNDTALGINQAQSCRCSECDCSELPKRLCHQTCLSIPENNNEKKPVNIDGTLNQIQNKNTGQLHVVTQHITDKVSNHPFEITQPITS